MKKIIGLFFLLFFVQLSSQQKYQSLLWKVSGNNLEQDSYLYGTMHVSSKVAFRLDDIFYQSLMKSDVIALESDPTTWLSNSYESMNAAGSYYNQYGNGTNFYENLFKMQLPNELAIRSFIRFDNSIINGYLYRKNSGADNFEEETYLDMFIYQAGKKQEKEIVGLENFKESRYLTTKASYNPVKKKLDVWLRKKYKEENNFMLTEDAYRNRNLDLLDSIGEASNTPHFRKYMLYERNANMVNVLDSLMHLKSVFSGVGAAHLPGDQGMIEMLRAKGYTVTALKSGQSGYGKKVKEEIEGTFIQPKLKKEYTEDKFLAIKSFEKLRELNFFGQKYYVATDMTNGGYLAITRINTFDYLSNKPKDHLKKIDDLLFEDIPGEIISKEALTSPFKGIKIINKTKKDDYQGYLIYKTPLEIIIIKLGGKKEYVLKYGDKIFNSVAFKTKATTHAIMNPIYGKYSITFPENYIAENLNAAGKRILQSYDEDSFYFLQEVPLYDTKYIEEDTFEAKYINEAFCKNLKLDIPTGRFNNSKYASYESVVAFDSVTRPKLRLKSIVKDEVYYLMGFIGKDSLKAAHYFNSFKHLNISYKSEFKKVIDTSLHFSVYTSAKPPVFNRFNRRRKQKDYEEQRKTTKYTSKTNEQIEVTRTKYHDLQMFNSIDSVWNKLRKKYRKDFIVSNEKKATENQVYTYSFIASDSLSKKQIRVKNILNKGTLFELKTLEDEISKSSKFVEEFYATFTVIDTLLGRTPFKNKATEFLEALSKNDSIIYKSFYQIEFKKSDVNAMMDMLTNHEFSQDTKHIKQVLISKLLRLDDKRILSFLKQLYKRSYNEPENQISILRGLVYKNDLESHQYFLELLAIDFPISTYGVNSIFSSPKKSDSLALRRKLFPELLKYSSVQEYKKPIYTLLSQLKEENYVKPRLYKKYKNQIFNDAKIELKRSLTKKSYSYSSRNYKTNFLDHYINLLFPYREEKEMVQFFNKLIETNDMAALAMYVSLLKKNSIALPSKLKDKVFNELANIHVLADKLSEDKMLPNEFSTDALKIKYAQSKLFDKVYYSKEKDTVAFFKSDQLKLNKKNITIYFFKLQKVNQYNNSTTLYYIAFENQGSKMMLKPYFSSMSRGVILDETKTEDELITEALEKIKHKKRKRIVPRRSFEMTGH